MFRKNDGHSQEVLFNSTQWMSTRVLYKLNKSWAPIFYEHVFCNIDETPFSVLYGTTGKPNFPVNILLSLDYIKHMKQYNDLDLLDAFYFDYMVNYAVGIKTLGEVNLAERTLYYFRERVYQYCLENPEKEDILFGQFLSLLKVFAQRTGTSLEQQRTDTTLFMSNIKKAGRMSLAYDVLIKTINAIPEDNRTEELKKVMESSFKTDTLYRSKGNEAESRLSQLLNLCNEALVLLEKVTGMKSSEEARIARRFLKEQSSIDSETGKVLPKPKNEITSSSLQSAYDEDATYRVKGGTGHSGYVLELSETCSKENTVQFITDYVVAPNNTSDVEIFSERIGEIKQNTGCTDMYVDGGFHSEEVHNKAADNKMTMHLTNMSGTKPRKKVAASEFDISSETYIISKCPMGHTPIRANVVNGQSSAHFSLDACANCQLKDKCFSKIQRKDCVVRISVKAINAGIERAKIKSDQVENTSMRAGIEGSNSALKRTGLKKLSVRGKVKCCVVCALKVTAQNIKRFTKYLQGGYEPKPQNMRLQGIIVSI